MKQVTEETTEAWLSGDYVGDRRPFARATITRWHMFRAPYQLRWSDSATWKHDGRMNSALFKGGSSTRELRNIKSIKWERGVDTDVASCTIVLANVQYRADMENANEEEFDFPGWFTPNRGADDEWNYEANVWKDWLLPDRIIKTWEGFGHDRDVAPEQDPNMYPSGVWLIDDVDFGTDGLITLRCRDLGRLLLDQIAFPPIIPFDVYPLYWEKFREEEARHHYEATGPWLSPNYDRDSNEFALASGLYDGTLPAVSPNGQVYGHAGNQACDGSPQTYWLSAGAVQPNQLEWIQFQMPPTDMSGLKINVRGGPYKVYISVFEQGKGWRGAPKIPYEVPEDGANNHADIKYVKTLVMRDGETENFNLPRVFKNVTKVRITFASRWNSGVGKIRRFRTAVQEVRYCTEIKKVPTELPRVVGNYGDYTDIIKWIGAWAGFFWPPNATIKMVGGGTILNVPFEDPDPVLPRGRVWGDFMQTGTTGLAKLDVGMFDKKPLMDAINAVREIVGFDFWIDETGAMIWRMPNVWKKGNYLQPALGSHTRARTQQTITIDERTTLLDLSRKLSSRNVRERVLVADVNGNFARVVKGYNPAPTGMMRVAGWTDGRFRNAAEARQMADLIAVKQAYKYQQNTITIVANPALQIDDQILIKERMTGETGRHRIQSIGSDFDFETGRWTYNITTNWLGTDAFTERAWEPEISQSTKQYLNMLGGS